MKISFRFYHNLGQVKPLKVALLACALLTTLWLGRASWHIHYHRHLFGGSFQASFPKKIWQIWHDAPEEQQPFVAKYQDQWRHMNPGYRYKCLNQDTEDSFVYKAFRNDGEIRRTYDIIKYDPILRADFLRYLILLAEGGVYTDADTRPLQPIENWVPQEYLNRTNVVVGVEVDKRQGPIWRDVPWTVQMSQFTIMAKPRHPLIRRVVENVEKGVEQFFEQHGPDDPSPELSFDEIIGLTGPRVFTTAVFQYLSEQTGFHLYGDEVSGLTEPFLLADVLIQPVNGFASGQLHSESGKSEDPTALVSHWWMSIWVPAHPHQAADNPLIR